MSPGGFAALLGATAVSVVVAGIVVSVPREFTDTNRARGEPMFPELSERAADRITVTNQGYALSLARLDGAWIATDRADYPAKDDLANGLLDSLAGMTRIEAKTDDPDWYEYVKVGGPDAPPQARGNHVVVTAGGGGVLVDAIVGSRSGSMGYSRFEATFVRPAEERESWLVEGSVSVPSTLAEWFEQLLHVPATDVVEVTIFAGDEVVLKVNKPGSGDYVLDTLDESVGPPGSTVNAEAFRSLTQAVVNVTLEDVRARDGLVVPPDGRTVRFMTGSGLRIDVKPVEDAGRTWVIVDATAEDGTETADEAAAIEARVDGWAFVLPERRSAVLTQPLETLVYKPGENPAEPAPPPSP